MMKRKLALALGIAAAFAVAAIGVAAFSTGGSSPPGGEAVGEAPDAPADPTASRSSGPDGAAEGIGVRGDWVLTVLNEDGSVADEYAFHNDLVGQRWLAELLVGSRVLDASGGATTWGVELALLEGSYTGQCEPGADRVADGSCLFRDLGDPVLPGFITVYYGEGAAERDGGDVVINMETEQFAGPGTVAKVSTDLPVCGIGETDSANCNGFPSAFTQTYIDPVDVLTGQRILVTVTLSFGTLTAPTPAP